MEHQQASAAPDNPAIAPPEPGTIPEKGKEPLRVVHLFAQNVKRLRAVSIHPDPANPIIKLTGRNRQGKSSILESVWSLLLGEKYIPEEPIRDGADRAEAFLDFGEFTVRRTFTLKGSSLTVTAKDGFKAPSPQTFLSSKLGNLVHNPLEFMRMKAGDQVQMLQNLVEIKVDLEEFQKIAGIKITKTVEDEIALFDQVNDYLYKQRTKFNQEVERLQGVVKSISLPEDYEFLQPVSVNDLFEQRKALEEKKKANDAVRARHIAEAKNLETLKSQAEKKDLEIQDLESRLESMKKARKTLRDEIANHEMGILANIEEAAKLIDPDFTEIESLISSADETNRLAQKAAEYKKASEDLTSAQTSSTDLTTRMLALKAYKGQLIEQAGMPVPGLGFENGAVTYSGHPLSSASGAEQIHVSCAVCMASHPEIGLLTIDVGWSELDQESQAALRDWAEKIGCHILVTKVAEEPEADGWHIFDGEVVAVDGKPVEKTAEEAPADALPSRKRGSKKKNGGNGDAAFEPIPDAEAPPMPAFMSDAPETKQEMPPRLVGKKGE